MTISTGASAWSSAATAPSCSRFDSGRCSREAFMVTAGGIPRRTAAQKLERFEDPENRAPHAAAEGGMKSLTRDIRLDSCGLLTQCRHQRSEELVCAIAPLEKLRPIKQSMQLNRIEEDDLVHLLGEVFE